MPPNSTPLPPEQPNHRKRPSSQRVLPAIPLSLSRPLSSKPKPKAEPPAKNRAESVTQASGTTEALQAYSPVEPTVNGDSQPHLETDVVHNTDVTNDVVTMPKSQTPVSRGSGPMSISSGATPELQEPNSNRPSTPPPAPETVAPVSPSSARKSVNGLDMRQIRTELPPLAPTFIPSAEQHTPKSAGSSHSNRPSFYQPAYASYPGANDIVFGGHESSTSSPVPPHSAGSAFAPPPYNNSGNSQQAYSTPYGHFHHASEPHPQRPYQPFYPQPAMQWAVRQGYGQSVQQAPYPASPNPMAFRYPPREAFTPNEARQRNGRSSPSRSASQTSSPRTDQPRAAQTLQSPLSPNDDIESPKAVFPEPKAAFPGHAHPRQSQFTHSMPPPPYLNPDMVSSMENAEALRAHIQDNLLINDLADCRLHVVDDLTENEQVVSAHRVILSRSPTLLNLVRSDPSSTSSVLSHDPQVQLSGQYLRIDVFMEALKYLYGGPLLQLEQHRPGSSAGEHISSNVSRIEKALRYIAIGAWLRVPAVASRGVEVASGLLHWDTISTALSFALDGGISQIWTIEDGSEDRASTSSSDDSLTRPEPASTPTYDPYATHLLQRIVDFTIHMFPPNFYLDASASQLASTPRLPPLPLDRESRQSRSDPRLSQIRFGEVPIEDHQRPSFATTAISSLLLSLPFPILKCVLEHYDLAGRLGPETVASIMRQVVAERETRRTKALNVYVSDSVDASVDAQLVQNLYWTESVETSTQHRAGSRLVRRRRDIDTPPSSAACSEHNK